MEQTLLSLGATLDGDDGSAVYLLVIFNNSHQSETFQLPSYSASQQWRWVIDTQQLNGAPVVSELGVGERVKVAARSVAILASERDAK